MYVYSIMSYTEWGYRTGRRTAMVLWWKRSPTPLRLQCTRQRIEQCTAPLPADVKQMNQADNLSPGTGIISSQVDSLDVCVWQHANDHAKIHVSILWATGEEKTSAGPVRPRRQSGESVLWAARRWETDCDSFRLYWTSQLESHNTKKWPIEFSQNWTCHYQVNLIFIALYTADIVSNQLHSNKLESKWMMQISNMRVENN